MWFNSEPCGILCGGVTWCLVLYAQIVISFKIIMPWLGFGLIGSASLAMYNSLAFVCLLVHLKAMLTDPGSVASLAEPTSDVPLSGDLEEGGLDNSHKKRSHKYCRKCGTFKPQRAHHCSICRRCIVKMDHHCPWINNCVGIGNQKFFIQFVCYVFLLSLFTLLLVGISTIACLGKSHKSSYHHHAGNKDTPMCVTGADGGLITLLLVLESTLFGIFSFCMGLDQWQIFSSGITQIDRLQGVEVQGKPNEDVSEVCGGGKSFRFDWLLPTKPCWSPGMWEKVMGYRIPCTNDVYDQDGAQTEMIPFKLNTSAFPRDSEEEKDESMLYQASTKSIPNNSITTETNNVWLQLRSKVKGAYT